MLCAECVCAHYEAADCGCVLCWVPSASRGHALSLSLSDGDKRPSGKGRSHRWVKPLMPWAGGHRIVCELSHVLTCAGVTYTTGER